MDKLLLVRKEMNHAVWEKYHVYLWLVDAEPSPNQSDRLIRANTSAARPPG